MEFGDGNAYYKQTLVAGGTLFEANVDYDVTVKYTNASYTGGDGKTDNDGFTMYTIGDFTRYQWEPVGTLGTPIKVGDVQSVVSGWLSSTATKADGMKIKPGDALSLKLSSVTDDDDYIKSMYLSSGMSKTVTKVEDKKFTYLWECDKDKGKFSDEKSAAPTFTATTDRDYGGKCNIKVAVDNPPG